MFDYWKLFFCQSYSCGCGRCGCVQYEVPGLPNSDTGIATATQLRALKVTIIYVLIWIYSFQNNVVEMTNSLLFDFRKVRKRRFKQEWKDDRNSI